MQPITSNLLLLKWSSPLRFSRRATTKSIARMVVGKPRQYDENSNNHSGYVFRRGSPTEDQVVNWKMTNTKPKEKFHTNSYYNNIYKLV